MELEVWKEIDGYNGVYFVSNLGRVKSLYSGKEKFLKGRDDGGGYLAVVLYNNTKKHTTKIHRLVAIYFLEHKPDGTTKYVIDHINEKKEDNRAVNLQILTNRENVSKSKKNKTSKYTGVSRVFGTEKWVSSIRIQGKKIYLGTFKNEIDASNAYKKALFNLNE